MSDDQSWQDPSWGRPLQAPLRQSPEEPPPQAPRAGTSPAAQEPDASGSLIMGVVAALFVVPVVWILVGGVLGAAVETALGLGRGPGEGDHPVVPAMQWFGFFVALVCGWVVARWIGGTSGRPGSSRGLRAVAAVGVVSILLLLGFIGLIAAMAGGSGWS